MSGDPDPEQKGRPEDEVSLVLVCGGDPDARRRAVTRRLSGVTTPALLLTPLPATYDFSTGARPDDADLVEVRELDPSGLAASWRAGAHDPGDAVLEALSVGADSPLASLAGWEYVRRAVASAFWPVVVVELEGVISAARRLAAVGELGAFVERHWPANQRFAAMSAGEGADGRVREAHRISMTIDDVEAVLSGPAEVIVASGDEGADPTESADDGDPGALLDLARGATNVEVSGSARAGFTAQFAAPAAPAHPPELRDGRLEMRIGGVVIALRLPAVLARCELISAVYSDNEILAEFRADPELWPPRLIEAMGDGGDQPSR